MKIKKTKQQIIEEQKSTIAAYKKDEQERMQKKEDEKKKRYSATVYCANCMHVNAVSIPGGISIDSGDCIDCRVRGRLLLVVNK